MKKPEPLAFHVDAGGKLLPVKLSFASDAGVRQVRDWRKKNPETDAAEFAALAAKRWFYFAREGAAVNSFEGLRRAIAKNRQGEFAFLMVASADWIKRPRFLALAYCRRSWCHHLIVDFLAVHPGLSFAGKTIRATGTGVLFGLVNLAEMMNIEVIWGEATAHSAPFYEKALRIRPVKDLFIIHRQTMRRFRERYLKGQKSRLAKESKQTHNFRRESKANS